MKSLHKKNEKNISPKKMQKQLGTQNDSKNKEMISQKKRKKK